jgi:MFS family permease
MLRHLFSFEGVNWWTLLGGLGLNFVLTLFASLGGAYLSTNPPTADFYARFGAPLMIIVVFLLCGVAGFITGKISDEYQVKHAFLASLGAAVPFLIGAVLLLNPMQMMLAAIAVAGNMNGGMLSVPKPKYTRPER